MTLRIGLHVSHIPGGSSLAIEQEGFRRDPERHRFVFDIRATLDTAGTKVIRRATMLISAEALESVPGQDEADQSRRIGGALATWLGQNVLNDGDVLRITVDDNGVEIGREPN